jgi:predicted TIM-barrel fold metal-dependent hydrolase
MQMTTRTAGEALLISADSHVVEPGDLWLERTARKFHDRVPKLVSQKEADFWVYESGKTTQLAAFASAGEWKQDKTTTRVSELRPAIFDPKARLEEALQDNVGAEVLYPSYAMDLLGMQDSDLQIACMRAYNDWLAEYCSVARDRLLPHAMIPSLDLGAAVEEIERVARLGFSGVLINAHPKPERDYSTSLYESMWAALAALRLPASLHLYAGDAETKHGSALAAYSVAPARVQRSLADIVFGGVFERHPKLQLVVVESDVGWVAGLMTRMDRAFLRKGGRMGSVLKSGVLPGEQLKQHVACVLTDDRAGILNLEITGPNMYMWGSDYPHNDSTWPDSSQAVETVLAGVPEKTRAKIVRGNAAKLYAIAA